MVSNNAGTSNIRFIPALLLNRVFFYFSETLKHLWRTERFMIFKKGLTARMTSSIIYSVAIILGYETVKKWSVHEEYKPMVKW